jgi:DNA-binding PadR family transcriptional regulator
LEYVILGFLSMGAMTGYDIKQLMSISTSFFYNSSYGSIYPALKKLESAGFVRSKEIVEHGRIRKVYTITEKGRDEFLGWLGGPPGENKFKYDFLTRMFFFSNLPEDKIRESIVHHIDEIRRTLRALEEIDHTVAGKADFFQRSTLQFGKDFFEFLQGWFTKFLDDITQSRLGEKP